ncbi:MAG: GspE/PulE family protein [Patescibacteria group bacterium]
MFLAKKLQEQLQKQRKIAEENDAKRRATQLGIPYLDLIGSKTPIELKALGVIKEEEAKKALITPFQIDQKKLFVAAFNPALPESKTLIESLKQKFELHIVISSMLSLHHGWSYYQYVGEVKEISGSVEINEAHIKEFQSEIKSLTDFSSALKNFKSPYTSQILEIILAGAMAMKTSDIHLEPSENENSLRLRVDGLLHTIFSEFTPLVYKSVVTRIKLLSNLKLNIHNEAQDGRFTIRLSDRDIEVRTSVIPSEYGETLVLRLLDPLSLKANLEELGWRTDDLDIIKKEIDRPNGLILNTGPTGSGKTTTLYAFLKYITDPEIKIITIEDPIEYHLEGISQTQVDADANYTFASGLRSILRQDPDIVLVGEIRDKETAEIAMNASLTGHLVFSTLHTNDAVGAIPRLIDLGAKTQIIGPALNLVIAQRLVRVLCPECRVPIAINDEQKEKIKNFIEKLPARVDKKEYETYTIYGPKGCPACAGIGYKGRISIFELFAISEKIEELIYKNPTELELKEIAQKEGMVMLQEDGFLKVLKGKTSIAEVERLAGKIEWLEG